MAPSGVRVGSHGFGPAECAVAILARRASLQTSISDPSSRFPDSSLVASCKAYIINRMPLFQAPFIRFHGSFGVQDVLASFTPRLRAIREEQEVEPEAKLQLRLRGYGGSHKLGAPC